MGLGCEIPRHPFFGHKEPLSSAKVQRKNSGNTRVFFAKDFTLETAWRNLEQIRSKR